MIYTPQAGDDMKVCERVEELRAFNMPQWRERAKVRQIMNNRQALAALLGDTISDPEMRLPIANLMVRANTVLATKLGRPSSTKVDVPAASESDLPRRRAAKRARVVASHDEVCEMEMLLPQIGRWLPGYGFTAAVVKQGYSIHGEPFPTVELRDPFQTFPGEWGPNQHPADMGVVYRMSRRKLAERYPDHKDALQGGKRRGPGGAWLLEEGGLGSPDGAGWSSQSGQGVDVFEYYDERGCWWVVPECGVRLEFVPNVLSSPSFRVVKRFCFDELVGALDHAIGVLANLARLALLGTIAVEDGVLAETNVFGELRGDKYRRGRNAVNIFSTGTHVERSNTRVPFETFTQQDRIERQLRLIAGHSPMEDGESALSFATGKGLQELQGSVGLEVREYQTAISAWKRAINALRMEHDEKACDVSKTMYGIHAGAPFAETYRPSTDIKGDYRTREVYGAMAGFDDATKIITGLQLEQAGAIDMETFREQLDGLENLDLIAERVRAQKIEAVLMEGLMQNIAVDPKAREVAMRMLPSGEFRAAFEEIYAEEEASAEPQMPAPAGAPPDVQTILSRLQADGQVDGGSQIVARV